MVKVVANERKKVMPDTNIYGRMVEFRDSELILNNKDKLLIYGSAVIRKELRGVDAEVKIEYEEQQRKLRIILLSLYDSLVGERTLGVTPAIERLAEQYFSAYQKLGGKAPYHEIIDDFTIVATASIHSMQIVYSDDKDTLVSEQAAKAYSLVNDLHNLPTPEFRSYEDFKRELKKPAWRGEA